MIEYIIKEFNYDWDHKLYERAKRDFKQQLNYLRKDSSSHYTNESKFRNYRLKSFDFDSQGWSPFALEVINEDAQFISFFTFTDEAFYRGNSIDTKNRKIQSNKRDSVLLQKINLEKNINLLVAKLGIKEKESIENFIELIFVDLLSMNKISKDSIENEMKFYWNRSDLNDSIHHYVDIEQLKFFEKGDDHTLMVRTKYSGPGYWRFWIEEKEGLYKVKSIFFSDMLYRPIYM